MLTDTKLLNFKPKINFTKSMTVMASMLPLQPQGLSPFATTIRSMEGKKPLPLAATE